MARSVKKGPYVDVKLAKKVANQKPTEGTIKTWARASMISPEMVGYTFGVHNGRKHIEVFVTEDMVDDVITYTFLFIIKLSVSRNALIIPIAVTPLPPSITKLS